jgi:CubicO group peptidase (beta-lactamase class C family)
MRGAAAGLALLAMVPLAQGEPAGREPLSAAILSGEAHYETPLDLSAYAMPRGSPPTHASFHGRLRFTVLPADAHGKLVIDRWNIATPGGEYFLPPAFDFGFVEVDEQLVPVERGIVTGSGDWWDWIVGPGRTWQDGDSGWSRASLPFALMEKNANCLHHGVLTFRYRNESEVSHVAYQVSHETCYYFQFDAWGTAAATRQADPAIDEAAVTAGYRSEVARRFPVKPIERLAQDFPRINAAKFGSTEDIAPGDMTVFGVLVQGVHYAGGCGTRAGLYPYCDEMMLPSYSVAKSVVAGFALMRAELLVPGVRNAPVADYVPECRATGGWDGVTFEQLLDMATGRYDSAADQADEDASNTSRFFLAPSHAEKVRIACTRYPRKDPPGKLWVYHTTDTYLLGAALSAWWKRQNGAQADFYEDLLVKPVFSRLGLSPEVATTRRTLDDARQPFTGWGLVLRREDLLRLGAFLSLDEGKIANDQLLDPAMVRAALQREPTDAGYRAAEDGMRYNNGVWAWDIAQYAGCRKPAWIPFMSGFGGISVAMPPNGIVYYYVSDGGTFRWARAVVETAQIRSVCRD